MQILQWNDKLKEAPELKRINQLWLYLPIIFTFREKFAIS